MDGFSLPLSCSNCTINGASEHYTAYFDQFGFSKNQQDALLGAVEQGIIKLIGATTENPSFEVNAAILSRSMVFRFAAVSEQSLLELLHFQLQSPK